MDPSYDTVNRPKHYTAGKYEVIDIIDSILESMPSLSAKEGSRLANIIKYLSRFKNKNGLEDLQKARWYLDKLIAENTQPSSDRESDGWVC